MRMHTLWHHALRRHSLLRVHTLRMHSLWRHHALRVHSLWRHHHSLRWHSLHHSLRASTPSISRWLLLLLWSLLLWFFLMDSQAWLHDDRLILVIVILNDSDGIVRRNGFTTWNLGRFLLWQNHAITGRLRSADHDAARSSWCSFRRSSGKITRWSSQTGWYCWNGLCHIVVFCLCHKPRWRRPWLDFACRISRQKVLLQRHGSELFQRLLPGIFVTRHDWCRWSLLRHNHTSGAAAQWCKWRRRSSSKRCWNSCSIIALVQMRQFSFQLL